MGEDLTRDDSAAADGEPTAPPGWVTTQQAARSLNISPRTVRWHIEQGNLEAKLEGEGVRRAWLVSIDSLQAFRDTRQQERPSPGHYRASIDGTDVAAAMPGNAIRELADRLVEEAAKASEFRVRFELAERAQSTLERELARQTHRREEAERERDELRRRLEGGARETAGPAETVLDLRDGVEGRSQEGSTEPREQAGRPYWWLIASLVLVLAAAVAVIAFFVVWLGLLP